MPETIYLDHAATSSPKPAEVGKRLERYFSEQSLSAGRGGYRRAQALGQEIAAGRGSLAALLNAESPDRIVLTSGGTESLNLAIRGLLKPGDHVILTDLEHNSVLRPIHHLIQSIGLDTTFICPQADGIVEVAQIRKAVCASTRLICCVHASNVVGTIQPVADICELARSQQILTLIDAAQTVGHLPIDVRSVGCDLLAAPAHKGLLAPLGVGLLYVRNGLEQMLDPLMTGGTGSQSELPTQPAEMPSRYESGSPNVPGLLGLATALKTVTPEFVASESKRQQELTGLLLDQLAEIEGVTVHAQAAVADVRVGVVSLAIVGQDPRIVDTILDSHFGIEVRSGLHCAPRTHDWLGTAEAGGSVRLSLGHSTTSEHITAAVAAIRQIAQMPGI